MVAERLAGSEVPEQLAVHSFLGLDDSLLPEDEQAEDVGRALEVLPVRGAQRRLSLEQERSELRLAGAESHDITALGCRRVTAAPALGYRLLELLRAGLEHARAAFEHR